MKPLSQIVAAFDAAAPRTKAAIIAAFCGVFGVLCGGVLYIVFAHLFEHGEARGKLIGTGVGLLVSIIIAWFADRLWAAIDDGRFSLGEHTRRTIVAVVSLVIVFELSASAFEDLARAYWSDRAALARIAGDIAGRHVDRTFKIGGGVNGQAFLDRMRAEFETPESACKDCVQSPAMRLYALLPEATRIRLFASPFWPTDEVIQDVFLKLERSQHGFDWSRAHPCWPAMEPAPAGQYGPRTLTTAELTAKCRNQFMRMSDIERATLLKSALDVVITRPDLYDAESFRYSIDKKPLELGHRLRARLEQGRKACDSISAAAVAGRPGEGCLATIRDRRAIVGTGVIEPISEIRLMNWQLVSATFGDDFIERPAIDWWDLTVLFAIWSAVAVVLGISLTIAVFEGKNEGGGWRIVLRRTLLAAAALASAALVAGTVLVLSRLLTFLMELMFDPIALGLRFSVLAAVPWLVQWLDRYGLGISIPGYVSLPLIVGLPFGLWLYGWKRPNIASRIAGYAVLGIIATCVLPVFDGLFQVVLVIAGAWLVPMLGLALLLPYLKPVANLPQWWGAVALAAGLLVAFWVGTMVTDADAVYRGAIAAGGLLAAVTGIFVLRRVPVGELWPLIAVTAGLTLLGGAAIQQLTFSAALNTLRPVSQTPVGERIFTPYDLLLRERPGSAQREDETIPREFTSAMSSDAAQEAVRLELALTGSIGFWLTIGMLVAWSLKLGARTKPDAKRRPATAT